MTIDPDAYWMPFTANRSFKKKPGVTVRASGAYLEDAAGIDLFPSSE